MQVNLDSTDLAILAALQDNARLPIVELARRVNLSPTPCTLRIRRMEEAGIIDGYHARLKPRPGPRADGFRDRQPEIDG